MPRPPDADRVRRGLRAVRRPEASFLFCGADPCWTPERERYVAEPVPGAAQGRQEIPEHCPVCGGASVDGTHRDPIRAHETVVIPCGRCMREPSVLAGTAEGDVDYSKGKESNRPGKMAGKVVGKESPVISPYMRHREEMDASREGGA